MLVLYVSVALLFGAPALLLWMGRLIERRTDFSKRGLAVAPACSGDEWYFRPPASLLGESHAPVAPPADQAWPQQALGMAWYRRPLRPLFTGFRWPGFGRQRARTIMGV